jgi:energy-coupling factor transporter transmembrane protein EcfT
MSKPDDSLQNCFARLCNKLKLLYHCVTVVTTTLTIALLYYCILIVESEHGCDAADFVIPLCQEVVNFRVQRIGEPSPADC